MGKRSNAMKRMVEFLLEDGTSMLVEVEEPEQGGVVKAARSDGVIDKAHQTLEKSLEKVKPAAQVVIQKLRELHDAPDEVGVSFGLKLSAEAGAVLASGGVEANYIVTLKWVKEKDKIKAKPKK
jgi:hypothetical protein